MKETLMTKKDLADLLHTSQGYISNQIYLGNDGTAIPPSIKVGRKRLWLTSAVESWLLGKSSAKANDRNSHKKLK